MNSQILYIILHILIFIYCKLSTSIFHYTAKWWFNSVKLKNQIFIILAFNTLSGVTSERLPSLRLVPGPTLQVYSGGELQATCGRQYSIHIWMFRVSVSLPNCTIFIICYIRLTFTTSRLIERNFSTTVLFKSKTYRRIGNQCNLLQIN